MEGSDGTRGAIARPDALVARARERAGLSDFGPDGWQEGLERLVAAVPVDIGDNPEAVAAIEGLILQRLINRLRIERWYAEHGADAAQPVLGPVVVLGLPRTGTTALHYLLGVDPQFRYQRTWEVLDPVPPPRIETESDDPRRRAATPRHNVRHISSPDGPVEDVMVFGLDFHNQELGIPVPTYTRWWRSSDLTSAFAYHERVLRMLHAYRPPHRWLLKAPMFLFHATQLGKHYPDARFLMTHRDPAVAMASACSTIRDAMQMVVPAHPVDPVALGREVVEHFAEGSRRIIADRRRLGEDRFIDVGQPELEGDPLGTAERIYDFLDLELTDEVRTAIEAWGRENRRGARGTHHYSPEEYGLTARGIRAVFAEYIERFGPLAAS